MPLLTANHRPPFYLFNGHLQTIVPALFRRIEGLPYRRERLLTDDGDFLDLDWMQSGSNTLAILSHGLEGDSQRSYMTGMATALAETGMDVLAWNYRSCSGEPNLLLRTYHLGATDDLHRVLTHALATGKYDKVYLLGFSAGGNITLKYLGEDPDKVPQQVEKAAVFSVPVDLYGSSVHFNRLQNRVYLNRFLKTLRKKMTEKAALIPGKLDVSDLHLLNTFEAFDDRFTAPMHGFASAHDYYKKCSSRQYLKNIRIPTLVVNAQNDPFLSESCYPVQEAEKNHNLFLELPEQGGHVGFTEDLGNNIFYSEQRAKQFLLS